MMIMGDGVRCDVKYGATHRGSTDDREGDMVVAMISSLEVMWCVM